jgi:hypothetical protein
LKVRVPTQSASVVRTMRLVAAIERSTVPLYQRSGFEIRGTVFA